MASSPRVQKKTRTTLGSRKASKFPSLKCYASLKDDHTMTVSQSWQDSFFVVGRNGKVSFRARSNMTLRGYKSGYHEAAVPTDLFDFLSRASENANGTHTLGPASSATSSLSRYKGRKVNSETLGIIIKQADRFRTDTAQTILSAPKGRAAGHAGSETKTDYQAEAHDLVRHAIMAIMPERGSKPNGLSEESVATLFGAITVSSMAPGVVARAVTGGSRSLKAGIKAKNDWEINRNEAKRRVNAKFKTLTADEQDFVHSRVEAFINTTQGVIKSRRVARSRATSPEREPKGGLKDEVQGGGYVSTSGDPSLGHPAFAKELGTFFTQPFRAARRTLLRRGTPSLRRP